MRYETAIREMPAIRVAALAQRGDYAQISKTFEQLSAIAGRMNLFGPWTRLFAIYYDDPAVTPQDALRAEACLTLPEGRSPGDPLQIREIRGGQYAVTLHIGAYAELGRAYEWLYGTWLPRSGHNAADAPLVEAYLNDARTVTPNELRTEIWLALQ